MSGPNLVSIRNAGENVLVIRADGQLLLRGQPFEAEFIVRALDAHADLLAFVKA